MNPKEGDDKRQAYTHFFSLPMNTPEIQDILKKWHDDCKDKYENIPEKCFLRPQVVHITLLMLPLGSPEAIEKAKETMNACEPKIKAAFEKAGVDPKEGIKLSFEGLKYFGSLEKTKVIYMKLKEEGRDFELVRDMIHILVQECLDTGVLEKSDLSHCNFNKQSNRYELEQLHLTIVNCSWAGKKFFPGEELIGQYGEGKFVFPDIRCNSLQISTRFNYDDTGFYQSQQTMDL
jgi:2'-5' RNA ligase